MFNLQRLTYFVAVLDHGTITGAADALRIAQPALSRQVHLLERELGLTLFTRERGRLLVTPAGAQTGQIARTLLAQSDMAARATNNLRAGRTSSLTCVTTPVTARELMAPFLDSLTADDPMIITAESGHATVEDALRHGADFVVSPTAPSPRLATKRIARFPVRAMVALDHRWAGEQRASVTLPELLKERLIVPPTSAISRQELDAAMRQMDLAFGEHVVNAVDATSASLARTGRGVAVSTLTAAEGLWTLRIQDDVEDERGPAITLHAAWLASHFAAAELEALTARLAEHAQKLLGQA